MPRVQVCADEAFDEGTQTCTAPVWELHQDSVLLPPLSSQDGALIGLAIGGAWLLPWAWKQIGRFLDESSNTD